MFIEVPLFFIDHFFAIAIVLLSVILSILMIISLPRYPLELHLVHRNIHDDTVQEALTHENGMTVLGFKFKIVDDENVKNFFEIWNK